ncbi:peroxisomal nicotinamide adenine dinucleotide carrier isoform X2 [Physcomitrium patens]|uniref:peroxisomal nicotinamide adenine dinucleotide carrier isoform X2 n=1 Tax=Physcomitrium patens TaxID=3218 RepID=UPI003CCD210A
MSDAVVNGLAGAGGGFVAQVLTYPLQAVNTRQQAERKVKINVSLQDVEAALPTSNGYPAQKEQRGTIREMFQVIQAEGWGGLYRGLMPSLVGTALSQGVYYYFYQLLKNEAEARSRRSWKMGNADTSVGMLSSLIIAAIAGCANVLLTNPIWVIVTRMQAHKGSEIVANHVNTTSSNYIVVPSIDSETTSTATSSPSTKGQGTVDTVKDLYKEAGVRGFWKGVLPSLIMVCNPAIQLMLYESMLSRLTRNRRVTSRGTKHVSATEYFLLGAVAKLGATVVTYPLLVVKSRLQARQEIAGDKSLQYTGFPEGCFPMCAMDSGTWDAILKMIRHEGISGFYKGMSTKIVQSVAAAAILFMIKEELVGASRALVTKEVKIPKVARLKDAS